MKSRVDAEDAAAVDDDDEFDCGPTLGGVSYGTSCNSGRHRGCEPPGIFPSGLMHNTMRVSKIQELSSTTTD